MPELRPIVIVFAFLLLGGCAAWPVGDLGDMEPWPLQPKRAIGAVNLAVHGTFEIGGVTRQEIQWVSDDCEDWWEPCARAFAESGLVREVRANPIEKTPLRAEVRICRRVAPVTGVHHLTSFNVLTAFLLPAKGLGNDLRVDVTFFDQGQQPLGTVSRSARLDTWAWLFLLPVSPFFLPENVSREMCYDLVRGALIDARKQGLL